MYETSTTSSSTGLAAVLGVMIVIFILAIVLWAIPSIIVTWKLYKKAGFKGWESVIPYYSTYVFGVISKKPIWAVWTVIGLSVAQLIPIPGIQIVGLAILGLSIYLLIGFIEQYSASTGFWVGFIIFPIVALFMVDKVTYVGTGFAQNAAVPVPQPPTAAPTPITNPLPPQTDVPSPAPTPVPEAPEPTPEPPVSTPPAETPPEPPKI